MAVNKIVINNEVQIDLTADTVTPSTLALGITAHDKSGELIIGTMASSSDAPTVSELTIGGDLSYWDNHGAWDWFITKYGDQITVDSNNKITNLANAFQYSNLEEIPINLVCNMLSKDNCLSYTFNGATKLKTLPSITGVVRGMTTHTFNDCNNLSQIPISFFPNYTYTTGYFYGMCSDCYCLRSIDTTFMEQFTTLYTSSLYGNTFAYAFKNCEQLDELNLPIRDTTTEISVNMFYSAFDNMYRIKKLTFDAPNPVKWKNQVIDLSNYFGYLGINKTPPHLKENGYNTTITQDKVMTASTMTSLIGDADAYPTAVNTSRYNHTSAVQTLNSLPDTSAYLASSGGTNTIKITKYLGSLTGSSTSDLTEEEIAVATAKGWTVTLV